MKFKDYLKDKGISYTQAADRLNVHYQHLNRILNDKIKPGYSLACSIVDYTQGETTINELIPPYVPKQKCPCCGKLMSSKLSGQQKNN